MAAKGPSSVAVHGVKLDTLKDCLQFLEWLKDRKRGDVRAQLAGRLKRLLDKKYVGANANQIEPALSQFLNEVSNFHKKLCKTAGQSPHRPQTAINALNALLECIPKVFSAMYFLRYHVDKGFEKVGGGGWADEQVGQVGLYARIYTQSDQYMNLATKVDKYLIAKKDDQYGVIPGGFDPGELKEGHKPGAYSVGSAMASDLGILLDKDRHGNNMFLDVYSTTVIGSNGIDIPNIANAVRLVQDFCRIFGNIDEKDFKSHLYTKDKCIDWNQLKTHCSGLIGPLEQIFKKDRFSFTGYGRQYQYLNKKTIAKKMASWFKKHLKTVKEELAKIELFDSITLKGIVNKLKSRKNLLPQDKANLANYFNQNFFRYGFTFYGYDFKNWGNTYNVLKQDWDGVISQLNRVGDGLDRLVDILNGEKCKLEEKQAKRKGTQTEKAADKVDDSLPEPPAEESKDESDVESEDDADEVLVDEEDPPAVKTEAAKPVATKGEPAKPTATKTEATKTDGGGSSMKSYVSPNQGKKAEGAQNQGKKAEGAQNQGKKSEGTPTAASPQAVSTHPPSEDSGSSGAHDTSSGRGPADSSVAGQAPQGDKVISGPRSAGSGVAGEGSDDQDSEKTSATPQCKEGYRLIDLWPYSGKHCVRNHDYNRQKEIDLQWEVDFEKTKRGVLERKHQAEEKLRRQKEAEERRKEAEQRRMEGEECEKEEQRQRQRQAMLPEIDVYQQQDRRLFDIAENDKSNFEQFFRNDLNVRGEVIRESPDVTLEIMHPTVPSETEEEELPNYPMPQHSQPLSPPTVDGSAITSNSDNFIRPASPAKAFSAMSITPTGFDGHPVASQIPKRNHPGANKRLRQYLTEYADVKTSVIKPVKLTHKPKHIMVEGHTTPNSKGIQRSMPPEFFASIGIPQGQPLKPSDTRVYMPPKTDIIGQATADFKGIQNFAVPQGSAAIGIPMGYTIKDPKTPSRSTIHLLPAPTRLTKPIRMKPTGIAMPAHKHPPILRHVPITTETFDDPSMARFLHVSGTSLTKSSKADAKAPVLQEIDPPVPQSMVGGSPVPDAELPSSPIPRATFLTEPQPTMGFQIEFPKRTVRKVEPEIGLSIEVANHGDRTFNDVDVDDPYANTADILKDELNPSDDKGFSGLPNTNFDLNFATERVGLDGYEDPGMPRDSPRKADERLINPFSTDECHNPWSVDTSSTDTAPPPSSPPPVTDHLPLPRTVREMLYWFVGLNQYGLIGVIGEHYKSILKDINKDTSQPIDAIDVTGDPDQLTASMVTTKLTETCLYSATVIYKVRHNNDFKAFSTFDFESVYSQLHYSTDPACLPCQLRDYVYACCHQLEFLKAQCKRGTTHGGWQGHEYGHSVSPSDSPLQAFLTDGWESDFETHPFDPCNLCLKSRIRMRFKKNDLLEKSENGITLSSILTPSCGGEDHDAIRVAN